MQSIDPRSGESNRQGAFGTLAKATDPFSRPAEPPLMLPNDPSTRNTFEALNEDTSDLDAIARDLDDLRNLTITKDVQQRKERIEEAIKHKEELEAVKAARQSSKRSSRSFRESLPSPVPLLLQSAILSLKECAKKQQDEVPSNSYQRQRKDLRFGYEQKREQALASDLSDPNSSDGDPKRKNREGNEWDRHGRKERGHGGPTKGQGNEPLKDPGRGYEPPGGPRLNRPPTSTPFSTRVLARHTYGTLALDDDDDFLKLGTADPHSRAKELALFAKSFFKELKYSSLKNDFNIRLKIFADHAYRYGLTTDDYLAAFLIMLAREAIGENLRNSLSECFEKLAKELKGIQSSLRPSLKDDKSLADKLYSLAKSELFTSRSDKNQGRTENSFESALRYLKVLIL
ncbi:hypothetical protein MBM_09273 [Drepanopeziza brunnea f. sp. 'multigermtubi' MB_m1]|uniref:Uncharacterized protein n=1 Tax=Marssonina brunnea f. sp. multigermtubi (strain MB_m1) TaxID=1072389 RepID=K1WJW6_MARBU|nr:uncharacterized protein MBM_09273 [Drepanopeziza brunnea f. sp. 'multigermtubi' MB_m1]EKD12517.1 hypothetical protein MBM_09273 [Drepanopeziza brunnea f. sp. 'multigermtubi' MB_m1]